MPLIVDANRSGDFSQPATGHAPEILNRIRERTITVVVGGKLLSELSGTKFRDILILLKSVGMLKTLEKGDVDALEEKIKSNGLLKSDDPHVIAVAILGNAELIYTEDTALIGDLKNPTIVGSRRKILTRRTPPRRVPPLLDAC